MTVRLITGERRIVREAEISEGSIKVLTVDVASRPMLLLPVARIWLCSTLS